MVMSALFLLCVHLCSAPPMKTLSRCWRGAVIGRQGPLLCAAFWQSSCIMVRACASHTQCSVLGVPSFSILGCPFRTVSEAAQTASAIWQSSPCTEVSEAKQTASQHMHRSKRSKPNGFSYLAVQLQVDSPLCMYFFNCRCFLLPWVTTFSS